jgi:hypothetical protein
MLPEVSILRLQHFATGLYPEPAETNPHPISLRYI